MTIELPAQVSRYFAAANDRQSDVVADCFTETATVRDEGHDIAGRAAIRAWAEESGSKYKFHADVRSKATEGDLLVVTAHLTGDFPGNPIDLRYHFGLEGEQIASLVVTP